MPRREERRIMKQTNRSVYIVGSKTADDWRTFRATLATTADPGMW